jgi:hypothetical protein
MADELGFWVIDEADLECHGFYVGFIDNPEAQLISHIKKPRVRGIVAAAKGIDVVSLPSTERLFSFVESTDTITTPFWVVPCRWNL